MSPKSINILVFVKEDEIQIELEIEKLEKYSAAGSEKNIFSPGRFPETLHFFIFASRRIYSV